MFKVDVAMKKQAKYRDAFFAEVLQHLWNATQSSNLFFGRKNELTLARRYLTNELINIPLIFYGEHGCGKTSMLAKIATEARSWFYNEKVYYLNYLIAMKYKPYFFKIDNKLLNPKLNAEEANQKLLGIENNIEPVLILRFLGTSPDSSSIAPLLISVCEQVYF